MAFHEVNSKVNFVKLEERVLKFWQDQEIFRKSLAQRQDAPRYVFYEGPPTANGLPGVHHVLGRVYMDTLPRYHTMKGKLVLRKGGWDCHGLPGEIEVEKELGLPARASRRLRITASPPLTPSAARACCATSASGSGSATASASGSTWTIHI